MLGQLSSMRILLGTSAVADTQTTALILTMQTAGEALNVNPYLHGLLADGTFEASGKFTSLAAIDTNALTRHFENEVLANSPPVGSSPMTMLPRFLPKSTQASAPGSENHSTRQTAPNS